MENRSVIAAEHFEQSVQEADFLSKNIIGDESWVLTYDPEMKHQSS
jgi:hypothetical protein